MALFDNIRNIVLEEDFKLIFKDNKVEIVNYKDIIHFDSDKIMVSYKDGNICVKGKNLVVSRLLKDELLIEGIILEIIRSDLNEK